jgi:hypothetical protein
MIDQDDRPVADDVTSSASPRQRAIEAYDSARERATDTLGQAPLLALAGGIAAGALIAALLPPSDAERRLVGPTARRLKAGASAAVETARGTSKERFGELGFSREKGEDMLGSFVQGLKDTAKASADAALDAARAKG